MKLGSQITNTDLRGIRQKLSDYRPRVLILDLNGDFFAVGVSFGKRDAGNSALVRRIELRRKKRANPHDHPDLGVVAAEWLRRRQRSRSGGCRGHQYVSGGNLNEESNGDGSRSSRKREKGGTRPLVLRCHAFIQTD